MGWLRRSYQIGFLIAGSAAIIFWAGSANLATMKADLPTVVVTANQTQKSQTNTAIPQPDELEELSREELRRSHVQAQVQELSLTVIISGVTCLVSTVGAFSTMLLSWRLDRRQSRETALRIAQLQIEVERARQVKVDQS